MPHTISERMRRCIDDCLACGQICTEMVMHCLMMGGKHAEAEHVRSLLDCAALCDVSAELMGRQSSHAAPLCELCADACSRCADSCERVGGDDPQMRQCADMCRRCADSCTEMSTSSAAR